MAKKIRYCWMIASLIVIVCVCFYCNCIAVWLRLTGCAKCDCFLLPPPNSSHHLTRFYCCCNVTPRNKGLHRGTNKNIAIQTQGIESLT